MCHCVLVFFSPFSIAITSLGEERANLSAFRTFVRFVLVWICRFPLPLGVWEGLRSVIVALPGLFSYLFWLCDMPRYGCLKYFRESLGPRGNESRLYFKDASIIQTERASSSLWQSSGHLFIVNGWKDPCKSPIEPTNEHLEQSGLLPASQWGFKTGGTWIDRHSKTASREMPGTECGPLHDLCWSYLWSIWHSQSCGTLKKIWQSLAARPSS